MTFRIEDSKYLTLNIAISSILLRFDGESKNIIGVYISISVDGLEVNEDESAKGNRLRTLDTSPASLNWEGEVTQHLSYPPSCNGCTGARGMEDSMGSV
jgi:hypothetical protein